MKDLTTEFDRHVYRMRRVSNLLGEIASDVQDYVLEEQKIHRAELDACLHKHRHGHHNVLFVSFFRTDGKPPTYSRLFEGEPIMQMFSNNQVGLVLTLAEFAKGAGIPLSSGPFDIVVEDPNNTVGVFEGTPDQTTPMGFLPNGTGNTGTVTVTATDTSVTPPLVAPPASFDVVAPLPPPPAPDQLVAGFTIPANPVVIPPAAPAVKKT